MISEVWRDYYLEALKNVNIDRKLHLTEEQLLEMADEVANFRDNEDLALGDDIVSNNRYGYQERQLRLAEAELEKAEQAAARHKRELDRFYTVRCPNCGGTGIKSTGPVNSAMAVVKFGGEIMDRSLYQLVPELELCLQIPDDRFQDSALVYAIPYGVGGDGKLTPALGYDVFPRALVYCDKSLSGIDYKYFTGDHNITFCYAAYPAPTAVEILEALNGYKPRVWRNYDEAAPDWGAALDIDELYARDLEHVRPCVMGENPATLLMTLWNSLREVNGI